MLAKTSAQPGGRRTPLSLSGTVTKNTPNKSGSNPVNSGGNNANGHTTSNSNKQDNKLQQQKNDTQIGNNLETKENPNKRQQLQADKKHQQNDNKKSNEKNQNGVNSTKQQPSSENKQQQQNKDKHHQQNGNDDNKLNEKDKKDKPGKPDKLDKQQQDKFEKEDNKLKENKKVEQDNTDNKTEEKKGAEIKNDKDEKKEDAIKSDAKTEQQQVKNDDKKSKEDVQVNTPDLKATEKVENMAVVEEQDTQTKRSPTTPKANIKTSKPSTPVNNIPTKVSEMSTPTNSVKTSSVKKREVTTTIDDDDVEMEPLTIKSSLVKLPQPEPVTNANIAPSATSTPGKVIVPKRYSGIPKSEVQLAMQTGVSLEHPRSFSQISGRKSIRQISDYTPSKFQSNPQFRESYRRINTELDATNTSMNVTVGSEVPNNLSFSFFGRGRKRDRTPPPCSQSAIGEIKTDMEISPPKRARLDMHGFFSAVSSPLALLRNRFSKASIQSSTPIKKLNKAEDEVEVQNVSGVSVHEEIAKSDKENNSTANDNNDPAFGEEATDDDLKTNIAAGMLVDANIEPKELSFNSEKTYGIEQTSEQLDIKITETLLQPAVGDPMAKNKRCIVM